MQGFESEEEYGAFLRARLRPSSSRLVCVMGNDKGKKCTFLRFINCNDNFGRDPTLLVQWDPYDLRIPRDQKNFSIDFSTTALVYLRDFELEVHCPYLTLARTYDTSAHAIRSMLGLFVSWRQMRIRVTGCFFRQMHPHKRLTSTSRHHYRQ
jgi:hypothetical protein